MHDPSTYEEMEARFQARVAKLPGVNHSEGRSAPPNGAETTVRINLNTASIAELQQLSGIGPALSERIEAYRSTHGPFRRVDDITRVRGIGEKTLAQIEPMLYVEETP